MDEELDALAARWRAAAEAGGAARAVDAAGRTARAEAGQAARAALMEALEDFGRALGVVEIDAADGALRWRAQGREVLFRPSGTADRIDVTWRELTPRTGWLYREEALADRWVLAVDRPHADRVPLRDQGLSRLLAEGLRLPAPSAGDPAAPAPLTTEAPAEAPRRGRRL